MFSALAKNPFVTSSQHVSPAKGGLWVDVSELIGLRNQAKLVDLRSVNRARSVLAGSHVSKFRGRGMDFDESRRYQAGDDVRRIDWRVTARTGEPHTKIYTEERERPVYLVVDYSPSMFFGSKVCLKSVTSAKAASLLAWATTQSGDRVGSVISTLGGITNTKPRSGNRGTLAFINHLASASKGLPSTVIPQKDTNCLAAGLGHINQIVHPGSLVIVLSDFFSFDQNLTESFTQLKKSCDLMLIKVSDPLEKMAPKPGRYVVTDGNKNRIIDTIQPHARAAFTAPYENNEFRINELCKTLNLQLINLTSGNYIVKQLTTQFTRRFTDPLIVDGSD
ncbi:MAG: DUF58 domain-containing protein [Gammaproteobacteria bacterium]|nr:DUF58 domain-containing protein [Gammaproteobacteria bacterium]